MNRLVQTTMRISWPRKTTTLAHNLKKIPSRPRAPFYSSSPFHILQCFFFTKNPKQPTNQSINQNPKWTIRGARWWWFAQRMRPSCCTCGARGRNWPRSPKGSPRTSSSLSRRLTPTSATSQTQSEPSKTSHISSKVLFSVCFPENIRSLISREKILIV
jgi:hypothetical protein